MSSVETLAETLRQIRSPYVVIEGWEPGEPYDAAICAVCLTVFPPFEPATLCPNCSLARAIKARRSRVLWPVAFRPWPASLSFVDVI